MIPDVSSAEIFIILRRKKQIRLAPKPTEKEKVNVWMVMALMYVVGMVLKLKELMEIGSKLTHQQFSPTVKDFISKLHLCHMPFCYLGMCHALVIFFRL